MVRVRRVAPVLLLAMAIPVFAATPKSSSHPPRELHRVGDHWTPYNPPDPSTYPANAKTYTIKAGDTLWALAQQFYGNAYLWPQLWESNTWITDAHWIYPGDVLLVEGEAKAAAAGEAAAPTPTGPTVGAPTAEQQPSGLPTAQAVPVSAPLPLATEADLYCYGYIGDAREPMPNRIESFEDFETLYQWGAIEQTNSVAMGDLVFVDGGTSTGLVAGETYLVVEPSELVYHPRTGDLIGRRYQYSGQIRILCADETRSRAMIVQSCREIYAGARIKPLPQLPIPLVRIPEMPAFCDSPSGKASGYIVTAKDAERAIGAGALVGINLGRDDQIQPGDFLTVYRDSIVPGQPRQVLGELGVLTTEGHTATARVVAMRRAMEIGDHIEVR